MLALAVVAPQAHADPAVLREADAQIRAGRPVEALRLLEGQASAEGGNAEYHYLVGIARLDAGDTVAAIVALRRSLEINPGLLQARAELGRAHALNGDVMSAYIAFRDVRAGNPPPEVLAGMERFIDEGAARLNPKGKVVGGVAVTLGHDTNVNSGTATTEVTLPIFGGIRAAISPAANPRRGEFIALNGYVTGRQALGTGIDLVGSAALSGRYNRNRDLEAFDVESGRGAAGVEYTVGKSRFGALGVYEQLNYGGDRLRTESGIALDWRWLTGGPIEIDLNYRRTTLDYAGANSSRDARREVFGLALLPSFFGRRIEYAPPIANVYVGSERPRSDGVEELGYELWGARAGYFARLAGVYSAFVAGGYEERRYGAPDPVFADTRRDRQIDLLAGLVWEIRPRLGLTPAIQWIDSRSNIPVYAYRRTIYSITLRQSF